MENPIDPLLGIYAYHNGILYILLKDGTLQKSAFQFSLNRKTVSLRQCSEAHGLYDFRINWRNLTWTARSFAQKEREERIFINH
jgi:hypothetical protein